MIPRNEFDDGMISMAHNCQAKLELMCMDILKGKPVQEVFGKAQRWLHEVIEGGQIEVSKSAVQELIAAIVTAGIFTPEFSLSEQGKRLVKAIENVRMKN